MARYAKSAFWFRGKVGRFAGATFYRSKGLTIQREIVPVSNPQTREQMKRRVRWGNLVLGYQYLQPIMKKAYENLRSNISEFNEFMKRNINDADNYAYMLKSVISSRRIVLAPWHISNGSLETIGTSWVTGNTNDSFTASGFTIPGIDSPDEATIGEISQALVSNNLGWRYGDFLSFVMLRLTRTLGPSTATLQTFQIELNTEDERSLGDVLPSNIEPTITAGSHLTFLVTNTSTLPAAAAFVHSRQQNGRTKVSTETLTLNNAASTMLDVYQTDSALQHAIDSYGIADDVFYDGQALPD